MALAVKNQPTLLGGEPDDESAIKVRIFIRSEPLVQLDLASLASSPAVY